MRHFALMFFAVCAVACLGPGALPLPGYAAGDDVVIQGVEHRYNSAQTLSVHFTETYSIAGRARRPEAGALILKKPGRMRWNYTDPPGKLFISNGKQIFLYSAADNRVERSTMKATDDLRAPLAFLLGRLDLRREFGTIQIRSSDDFIFLTADARTDRLPYGRVQMKIRPDYSICDLSVDGRDGSRLGFVFSNEILNLPVANGQFDFVPPPGAELVEAVTTGGGER